MRPGSLIRNILVGIVYFFGIMFILGALLGGAGTDSASDGGEPEADGGSEASSGGEDSSDSGSDDDSDDSSSDDSSDSPSGDSSSDDSSDESQSDSSDSGSDDDFSESDSDDDSDSSESSDSSSSAYSVRVIYGGEWSGSIAADGSSRSVDGSGEETFEIEGEPMSVSANAQKQDDSSDELTIQILQGGEVVAEQSTTAEYGVAQTSYSDF